MVGRPIVLLVNSSEVEPGWVAEAQAFCTVHRAMPTDQDIGARIKLLSPHVLCFEFGDYDPVGLALLARIKQAYLSLPILMITEEHSEALAIWALRTRVWDYFVKPVAIEELHWAITTLHAAVTETRQPASRRMVRPRSGERAYTPADDCTRAEAAVQKVRAYVARHLSEKISEAKLADRCAMSYFHLSRTFRRIAGMTLREYILRERIHKAAQLLAGPGASVTTVCFEVGFNDLSHFARMFRRYMGTSPSEYRLAAGHVPGAQPMRLRLASRE
jgi:AraC-like DNA-binding protein